MRHLKYTLIRDAAMVSPSRLEFTAMLTFGIPKTAQVAHGLGAIFYKTLYIFLETLEAVILGWLLLVWNSTGIAFDHNASSLAVFSLLDFFPKNLVVNQILWASRFDDHAPKVIKHDVVTQSDPNAYPNKSKEDSKSFFE